MEKSSLKQARPLLAALFASASLLLGGCGEKPPDPTETGGRPPEVQQEMQKRMGSYTGSGQTAPTGEPGGGMPAGGSPLQGSPGQPPPISMPPGMPGSPK